MADEARQEIQEGKEAAGKKPRKLFTGPVIAVGVAVCFVVAAGAVFILGGADSSTAQEADGERGNDPAAWRQEMRRWGLWELGTVWVIRRTDKILADRKISATFSLRVSRSFLDGLVEDQEKILKEQVTDLIQSILDTREVDVIKDPKRARRLIREDVLRGLKIGANPNDPRQKTYHFPFREENLADVFVKELQITQW
jgi:hypothetical protein